MDVRLLQSLTFFLTLLPWNKDNREAQLQLEGLKKQKNQKLQTVKNSRMYELSPNSVLSAISGSLSLPTLTFLVFLLLIQTSGGEHEMKEKTGAGTSIAPTTEDDLSEFDETWLDTIPKEDDLSEYDETWLDFDTIPKVDPSSSPNCIPREVFYAMIGVVALALALVLVLALIFIIVWACRRNTHTVSDSHPGDGPSPLKDDTQVPHTHSTKKEKLDTVSTLMEQEAETEDQIEELLPAHKEVDKEPKENQTELQEVQTETAEERKELQSLEEVKRKCEESEKKLEEAQTETAEVRKELQSQLLKVKKKCEESKKKLKEVQEKLENDTEMTSDRKQKLLGEKEILIEQKQILTEMHTEKEKVLIQMDKVLLAIDAAGKSMSIHKTV